MSGGAAYLEPSSLMDEMMAVFAPPGRGDSSLQSRSHVELHPYYKRPGKGHNHDSCDACGEGGDLICCDNCPASFHFACHAPPLEEEDIPLGDWICLKCYHREQLRLATANANMTMNMVGVNSKQSKDGRSIIEGGLKEESSYTATDLLEDINALNEPSISDEGVTPGSSINGAQSQPTTRSDSKKNRGRNNRSAQASKKNKDSKKGAEKDEEQKNVKKIYRYKYEKYLRVKPTTNSPFDLLVAATQVTNADQFKLPREMEVHERLPFSWKWSDEIRDAELLNGGSDDSPRCCTACFRTCRNVPSVGCDFCSSIYHLDCLDPPLCEIPRQERWMCPNHVENFIDSNLVTSTSLTERLKLWNKYGGSKSGSGTNFNPDSIKLEFFRKVRKGKLYERGVNKSRVVNPAKRIRVPQYIKNHYRNPIQGLSVEQGIPRLPNSQKIPQEDSSISRIDGEDTEKTLKDEHDEWLAQLVGLQIGLLQRQLGASHSISATSDENSDEKKVNGEGTMEVRENIRKSRKTKVTLERRDAQRKKKFRKKELKNEIDSEKEKNLEVKEEDITTVESQSNSNDTRQPEGNKIPSSYTKVTLKLGKENKVIGLETKSEKMNLLNNDAVKVSDNEDSYSTCSSTASECSFGDLGDERESEDRKQLISSEARSEIYEYLARLRKSKGKEGYNLDGFDPTLKDFLAMQRIDELFTKGSNTYMGSDSFPTTPSSHIVQSRAALVPLNNPRCREPCSIQRRSVDIGLGVSCGIDLSKVGHCNFISGKHATIFFDQYSRMYELINYSEHGTIVDNIIYTLNPVTGMNGGLSKFGIHSSIQSSFASQSGSVNNNSGIFGANKGSAIDNKSNSKVPKKKMSADEHQFDSSPTFQKPCNCSESIQKAMTSMKDETSVDGGCENSAILHHGSYIRIGCLQFAFTIVDYIENEGSCNNTGDKKQDNETTKGLSQAEETMKQELEDESHVEKIDTSEAASECEDNSQASDSMEIDP